MVNRDYKIGNKTKLLLTILTLLGLFFTTKTILAPTEICIHSGEQKDISFFETAFKFIKKEVDLSKNEVVAGVIPHHLLAADLIAEFFKNMEDKNFETIVIIGPNHFNAGNSKIITSACNWETPYGISENDQSFLFDIETIEEDIFEEEHSINNIVPFIKKVFPDAKITPIILKSNTTQEESLLLAEKIFELSKNSKTLILGSVDFSHYENSAIAQQNDLQSIDAMENFKFDEIYNLDLDSPATITILLKIAQLNNAYFKLLNNSNSAILANEPDLDSTTSYVTGYFIK